MAKLKRKGESSHPSASLIGDRVKLAIESAIADARAAGDKQRTTREYYAAAMQTTVPTLRRMFKGTSDPSAVEIWRLARETGRPFSWFAGIEEGQPAEEFALTADLVQACIGSLREQLSRLERDLADARRVAVGVRATGEAQLDDGLA